MPGASPPAHRLYQLNSGALVTRFQYDGASLVAEYDGANAMLRRYVHGPGSDEPIVWYEGAGTSSRRFLQADERGSVIAVSDSSGASLAINRYDEYGIPQTGNLGRFSYTGQTALPEIGLMYFKARMYSPGLGRFMQTDPIGYGDGLGWYNYVGSDPVNFVDPTGLFEFGSCQTYSWTITSIWVYVDSGLPYIPPEGPNGEPGGTPGLPEVSKYSATVCGGGGGGANLGFGLGASGKSGPRGGQTHAANMSEEEQEAAAEADDKICRIVKTRECWESAAERRAARVNDRPVPPLQTGVRSSWTGRDVAAGAGALVIIGGIVCLIVEPCGAVVGGDSVLGGGTLLLGN